MGVSKVSKKKDQVIKASSITELCDELCPVVLDGNDRNVGDTAYVKALREIFGEGDRSRRLMSLRRVGSYDPLETRFMNTCRTIAVAIIGLFNGFYTLRKDMIKMQQEIAVLRGIIATPSGAKRSSVGVDLSAIEG